MGGKRDFVPVIRGNSPFGVIDCLYPGCGPCVILTLQVEGSVTSRVQGRTDHGRGGEENHCLRTEGCPLGRRPEVLPSPVQREGPGRLVSGRLLTTESLPVFCLLLVKVLKTTVRVPCLVKRVSHRRPSWMWSLKGTFRGQCVFFRLGLPLSSRVWGTVVNLGT